MTPTDSLARWLSSIGGFMFVFVFKFELVVALPVSVSVCTTAAIGSI